MRRLVWAPCLLLAASLTASVAAGQSADEAELQRVLDESVAMLDGYLDAIDPADFDLEAAASRRGDDVGALFRFVRDEVRYEDYAGVLRGAAGCLRSRAGNSADRALLLADVIRRAGHEVRFARGSLTPEVAEAVLSGTISDPHFGALDLPYEIDSEALRAERNQASDALVDRVAARHARLLEALGELDAAIASDAAVPERLEMGHVWVQVRQGDAWVDLDPSRRDAEPGTSLCPAAETLQALPDDLEHRITLRGVVEELADGAVKTRVLWESRHAAADLAGVSVVVDCYPRGAEGVLASFAGALEGDATHVLGLALDGRGAASGGFTLALAPKRAGGGGFGALARGLSGATGGARTVAVGVEVELQGPDREPVRLRRYLLDRWGFAARATGDASGLAELRDDPALQGALETTALSFGVETGKVHPAQLQARLLATSRAVYRSLAVRDGRFTVDADPAGDASAWLLAAGYFHLYDRLTDILLEVDHHAVAPRLLMTRIRSGEAAVLEVDVTYDRPAFLAVDPARTQLEAGLLSAIVEEMLTVDPLAADEAHLTGAAALLETSLDLGAPAVVREAAALPAGLPAPLRGYLERELGRAWVVLPATADGASWFTFEPASGALTAWLANGHHGGAGEYAALNGEEGERDTAAASGMGNAMRGVTRCVAHNVDTILLSAVTGNVDPLEAIEGAAGCLKKGGGKRAQKQARKERKNRRHGGGRQQMDAVAREFGMSQKQRRDFGKYVERAKKQEGRGGNDNYSHDQLRDLAQEFLGR